MGYVAANSNTIEAHTTGLPPITSLSAVSTVGEGSVLDGVVVRPNAVMIVSSSAGVSAGAVTLEGSNDQTNWVTLGSAVSTSTASTTFTPVVVTDAPMRSPRSKVRAAQQT
jgi:hypothetical protein